MRLIARVALIAVAGLLASALSAHAAKPAGPPILAADTNQQSGYEAPLYLTQSRSGGYQQNYRPPSPPPPPPPPVYQPTPQRGPAYPSGNSYGSGSFPNQYPRIQLPPRLPPVGGNAPVIRVPGTGGIGPISTLPGQGGGLRGQIGPLAKPPTSLLLSPITTYRFALTGVTRTTRVVVRDPRTGQIRTTIFRPRPGAGVAAESADNLPSKPASGYARGLSAIGAASVLATVVSSNHAASKGEARQLESHANGNRPPSPRAGPALHQVDRDQPSATRKFLLLAMSERTLAGRWGSTEQREISGAAGKDTVLALLRHRQVRDAKWELIRRFKENRNVAANEIEIPGDYSHYNKKYTFNAITNPGPLATMESTPSTGFFGGRYNKLVADDELILYRLGKAGTPLGQYFTRIPPSSAIQARIDFALKPQWIDVKTGELTGESNFDTVHIVKFPKGTVMFEGPIASQGGPFLGGIDTEQIFVSKPWEISDVKIIGSYKLE